MAWFSGSNVSTVELDNKISEATSESIPNGELELSIALEITDLIRSKKIPAKQCMRSLKKRLTLIYSNPNLLTSTLKLIDLCVKNSGFHFLVEIASKEFLDYLIDFIFKVHYNTKDFEVTKNESKLGVGNFILSLVKEWSIVFENQLQLNYVEKCYKQLLNEGYRFPDVSGASQQLNSTFVDSEVPPDWVDNDSCMICYTPFSMINRKHHCRACGGVYCQTHSNHNIPLHSLGITESVRVCDNCYAKEKSKAGKHKKHSDHPSGSHNAGSENNADDEDEELKRAIELSLQDTGVQFTAPPGKPPTVIETQPPTYDNNTQTGEDDEDEEMKAAIAASLKEYEEQERIYKQREQQFQPQSQQSQPQQQQQGFSGQQTGAYQQDQSDFYNISIPFSNNRGPPQQQQQQAYVSPAQHIEQHQPQRDEDLSEQEEEQINLFITLLTNLKSDPGKQANILYDTDLAELHSKVIKLKPKVNKSLRASIEKYEAFLEMNNKISTITRLYDQFLEAKLNTAYGNHHIPQGANYYDPRNSYNQDYSAQPQVTGFGNSAPINQQSTGYSHLQPPQQQQQQQQSTSYSNAAPIGFPQQPTGYGPAEPVPRQSTGYPSDPSQSVVRQSTGYPSDPSEPIAQQSTGYPSDPYANVPEATSFSREESDEYGTPSYPNYPPESYSADSVNEDYRKQQPPPQQVSTQQQQQEEEQQQSIPSNYAYNQPSYPQEGYPQSEPYRESSTDEYNPRVQPAYVRYPPAEYVGNDAPKGSESGYPPEELSNIQPSASNTVKSKSSTLALEQGAEDRFPPIENVESKFDKLQITPQDLPSLPQLSSFEEDNRQESRKTSRYVAESEPLIDL